MGEHLNRLTKKDAFEFDKAFEQFCKTGEWIMADNREKVIEIGTNVPTEIGTNAPIEIGTHKDLEKRGIMADPSRRGKFPDSRDWNLEAKIPCANKKCICHSQSFGQGTCGIPSRMEIDSQGRCSGYKPKKKRKSNGG